VRAERRRSAGEGDGPSTVGDDPGEYGNAVAATVTAKNSTNPGSGPWRCDSTSSHASAELWLATHDAPHELTPVPVVAADWLRGVGVRTAQDVEVVAEDRGDLDLPAESGDIAGDGLHGGNLSALDL
jgi:hypothetical protein